MRRSGKYCLPRTMEGKENKRKRMDTSSGIKLRTVRKEIKMEGRKKV